MTSSIKDSPSENLWVEPESAASVETPPQYPYNNITQTESGHTFELDDTPGRERVRLQHRSGTFTEMHPNGDEVHKVYGTGYEIHIKGKNVLIKGVCNITVEGDCNMHVTGDFNQRVDGNYNLSVAKEFHTRVVGATKIQTDDDIQLYAGNEFSGSIYMNAPSSVFVNSDLSVAGYMNADLVTSTTRVDAGTGVSAGPLGIFSTGPITTTVSVTSPIASFGFSKAILATDTINKNIYRTHIHPAPKGITGTPKLKQI